MNMIIEHIEVFLEYGSLGVHALVLILNYLKDRQQMKVQIDSIVVMQELKFILQELVLRVGRIKSDED